MSESLRQKMIDALSAVKNKRLSDKRAMVVCPFHADKNPSASINLDPTAGAPLGWFRCFGCEKSVSWNEAAPHLGVKAFGKHKKRKSTDYLQPSQFKDELLNPETVPETENAFQEELDKIQFFDFQVEKWRGVKVKLLLKVGAKFAYNDYDGNFYVWLPVWVQGHLRGYVKAHMEKPEEGTSYINAKGTWSGKYGLLFYDYSVALAKSKGLDTLVLCEGPRDALRLLKYGIPAVSVLGAINWSSEKRFTLEQSGISRLILFMDGDDAGIKATKKIYKSCRLHFNVKYMSLWKHRVPRMKDNGKQDYKVLNGKKILLWDNELDPGNCPLDFIKKVKSALR
jgi:5S rRNA maturation endonuclease (ribonuclease M5)